MAFTFARSLHLIAPRYHLRLSRPLSTLRRAPVSRRTTEMRVLSIQSHVVSGYVGNRVATYSLETVLEQDVLCLNSCHLSNHTGYKHGAPGHRLTGDDFRAVIGGLRDNGLLSGVTHVLTGFIGTGSFLEAVADTVEEMRASATAAGTENALQYICDPVLGDNGRLYVPEELISIYRSRVLPLATVLTPNLYELGLLAEVPTPKDEESALSACRSLHSRCSVPLIVVTGAQFESRPHTVSILCSSTDGDRFALDSELLQGRFTGSGDLTAALVLAWRAREPDLRKALRSVMASVSAVLQRTIREPSQSQGACALPELRLVQSRKDLLTPPVHLVRVRDLMHSGRSTSST